MTVIGIGVGVGFPRAGGGGAAFAGAYDAIPDLAAVYGMRRTLTSYEGALIRLRRSSDNAELDIGADANGDLDTDSAATFIGGGSGFVVTWYDQSGSNHNATQATAANQPLYVANGQNGRPVARFDGTNDNLQLDVIAVPEISIMAVRKIVGHSSGKNGIFDSGSTGIFSDSQGFRFDALSSQIRWGTNQSFLSSAESSTAWHIQTATKEDGARAMYLDGSVRASDSQTGVLTYTEVTKATIGDLQSAGDGTLSGRALDGDIAELAIANAAWSDANREAAEAAANAYWSVF